MIEFEIIEWIEDRLYDDLGFSEVKVLSVETGKDSLYALVHCGINNKWAILSQDDENIQSVEACLLDERRTRAVLYRLATES
jgi:hypothetical protein